MQFENARQGFFEEGDFRVLLRELPAYLQPVMQFAYYTGWRVPSEILPLQWAQVDLARGLVRLEPGTTKKREQRVRTTALEKATGAIIAWVFHRDGKRIKVFRRGMDISVSASTVGREDPARLSSHSGAESGARRVPEKQAMALTGHKTRSVFDRYDIVNEADLRAAVGKLAALPAGATVSAPGPTVQPGSRTPAVSRWGAPWVPQRQLVSDRAL